VKTVHSLLSYAVGTYAYCSSNGVCCVSERMVRLQHENQLLKTQSASTENSQLLQSMLDDANTHKHELECQVRYTVSWWILLCSSLLLYLCSCRRAIGHLFASVCLSICLHSKRKMASAISTKVIRDIVHVGLGFQVCMSGLGLCYSRHGSDSTTHFSSYLHY